MLSERFEWSSFHPGRGKTAHKGTGSLLTVWLTVSIVFSGVSEASAYVDPNTGGFIFQLLFPIVSVAAFVYLFLKRQVKLLLGKMVSFFKSVFGKAFTERPTSRDNMKKGTD